MKIRGEEYEDEFDELDDALQEQTDPVELDELDDRDEDDEELTRKQRRERRGQERKGEREDLQEALAKSREEIAELRGRFEQMSSQPQPQYQPQGPDIEAQVNQRFRQLEEAEERAAHHLVSLEGKASQADIDAAKEAYWKAKRDNQQFNAAVAHARMQPPPPPPHVQQRNEKQAVWAREHKDVMENEHARAIANAELAKMGGKREDYVPTDAEVKKATDVARRILKLGAEHTDPTEHQRRATSGYPSAGSARGKEPAKVSNEIERGMAIAWYDEVAAPLLKNPARIAEQKIRAYEKHVLSDSE